MYACLYSAGSAGSALIVVAREFSPRYESRGDLVVVDVRGLDRLFGSPRAIGEEQASRIGNQTGGRVFLFLYTDDFWRDFRTYQARGVGFVREPSEQPYGTVAVFEDLYGNLWDLVQPNEAACLCAFAGVSNDRSVPSAGVRRPRTRRAIR